LVIRKPSQELISRWIACPDRVEGIADPNPKKMDTIWMSVTVENAI